MTEQIRAIYGPEFDAMRSNYNRRVLAMRKEYGMTWTRRQSIEFIDRLLMASRTEGVDDVDLRVLVRIYNREILQ